MSRPRAPLGLVSRVWGIIEEPKSVTLVQALIVYMAAALFGATVRVEYQKAGT